MRKRLIIAVGLPPLVFASALVWYAVTRPTVPPNLSCVFLHYTNELAGHRFAAFAVTNHSAWPVTVYPRYAMRYSASGGWTNHEALWCMGDWTLSPGEGFVLTAGAPISRAPWRAQFSCSRAHGRAERTLILAMAPLHMIEFARKHRPTTPINTGWVHE